MVDPITVSVLTHRFEAIVQEMGEAMLRTAYSQILNSSRDFSTAIADRDSRLVAQAEHVPIHVGAMPWAVQSVDDFFKGRVKPGDVYLLNDPYHGGNHLPDLTAFVPVFVEGELMFWSINRSHQSDIGGSTHGAYNPGATEIWQEGIRITPLKLYDAGEVRDDVMKMIATNVRHPDDFLGDLRAMIGSARVGERRVLQLLDEYGPKTVMAAVDEILDSAERETRACISTWKDGVFRGEAILDDDGHGITDIHIRATVTVKGDSLTIDLSDSHPQVHGFINSSFPNMMSAVYMALAFLIDPRTPKNSGTFRPVTVIAKQGTIVWPFPPAPVTLATNHCAQEIAESIIKALAKSCPDRVIAGWGRRFRIAIKGVNPRTQRQFIWHLFHARPGGGASPVGDGLGDGGRGAGSGRHQVRLDRGRGGALSAVLRASRVPARFVRRRAVSGRRGLGAAAQGRDEGAGRGQHRGRRRPASLVRHAGRTGRSAASVPPAVEGQGALPEDQGSGRARHAGRRVPRRVGRRRWLRAAREAARRAPAPPTSPTAS